MRVEKEADLPVDLSVAMRSCQRLPRDRRGGEVLAMLVVDSLTISSGSKKTSWGKVPPVRGCAGPEAEQRPSPSAGEAGGLS